MTCVESNEADAKLRLPAPEARPRADLASRACVTRCRNSYVKKTLKSLNLYEGVRLSRVASRLVCTASVQLYST